MKYQDEKDENIIKTLWSRENNWLSPTAIQRRFQSSKALLNRLEQSALLEGHEGCVNCLEWSPDGSLLASGSDDFHVMIWDPYKKQRIVNLRTNHIGNLFSVKFMPQYGNNRIITGSADKCIYMYDINKSHDPILCCTCHTMRVKRLATAPDSSNIFWSSGEDGTILQIDTREKHLCRSEENRVRLLNLGLHCYSSAEAKCLAINPRRTELMAVGASDPYARLYDRRMLHLGPTISSHIDEAIDRTLMSKDCVTYFCPGHITLKNSQVIEHESRAITYLTFNAAGTELLVNIGGEHIYLYDIINPKRPEFFNLPDYRPPTPTLELEVPYCLNNPDEETKNSQQNLLNKEKMKTLNDNNEEQQIGDISLNEAKESSSKSLKTSSGSNIRRNGSKVSNHVRRKLPEHIETFKRLGNEHCENQEYLRAIEKYSEAIALWPQSEVLYLNRATAYMRRLWYGDVYEALRDCHQALRLDPSYTKAHFRLTRALLELGRQSDAEKCLNELINRFPSYEVNHGVQILARDIKDCPQTVPNLESSANTPDMFCEGISEQEFDLRAQAKDYLKRFVGHCNTKTDIKEANFFGYDGNFIVAGSDDGNFYIWDRNSTKIHAAYHADGAIVNCVQVHPNICMLATSGIDREIRLWEPITEPFNGFNANAIKNFDKCVEDNQQKMRTDPFDLNSRNSFCWSN